MVAGSRVVSGRELKKVSGGELGEVQERRKRIERYRRARRR